MKKILQILLLLTTLSVVMLAIDWVPDLSNCYDPGGVGCVLPGLIKFVLIASSIGLTLFCLVVLSLLKSENKGFFAAGMALVLFLSLGFGIFKLEKQHREEIERTAEMNAFHAPYLKEQEFIQQCWKQIDNYTQVMTLLSKERELSAQFDDEYAALRIGLAMHYPENVEPVLQPLLTPQEPDALDSIQVLHYYLQNDQLFLDSHEKYHHLFSLIQKLKLGGINADGYELEYYRQPIVHFLAMKNMVQKRYYDLVDDSLELVRTNYLDSLQVAKSIEDKNIRQQAILALLDDIDYQGRIGVDGMIHLHELLATYELLQNENEFDQYMHKLLAGLDTINKDYYACPEEPDESVDEATRIQAMLNNLSGRYPKMKQISESMAHCF